MIFKDQDRKHINFNDSSTKGMTAIPYEVILPSGDWRPYVRDDERQKLKYDTNGCSEYSPMVSSVEAQLNWLLQNNRFSYAALDFFTRNGYIIGNQFQCSVEFNATLAGTTIDGNNPINFAISVERDGIIPESMLVMTLDESQQYGSQEDQDRAFYDRSRITSAMIDLGRQSKAYFNSAHAWIGATNGSVVPASTMQGPLMQSPLVLGVPIESVDNWNSGLVNWHYSTSLDHCIGLEFIDTTNKAYPFCFHDNYNPFQKRLASNYYISQVLQIVITAVTMQPPVSVPISGFKPGYGITKPLGVNSYGWQVFLLQNRLIQDDVATFYMPTGFFGAQTRASLLAYQAKNGLQGTGYCDPVTLAFIQLNG